MKIITVPNKTLRATAKVVESVNPYLSKLVADMEKTLQSARNPRGVGLAANQVDKLYRVFTLAVDTLQTLINPRIVAHSPRHTLGKNSEEPMLEGCLSIPKIFGPVPRWDWVEIEYQELVDSSLIERKEVFSDFTARVAQHELDHLDGVLFTDYSLEYNLPIYQEHPKTKELEEIDHTILTLW